jgi:hypothetical protein
MGCANRRLEPQGFPRGHAYPRLLGECFRIKACAGISSHTSGISRPSRSFMLIRSTTC